MQEKINSIKISSKWGTYFAGIYFLIAVIILFRWVTNISPVIKGDGFLLQGDSRNFLEVILVMVPILPAFALGYFFDFFKIIPQEFVYFLILVLVNTISWFFVGNWSQWTITTLLSLFKNKKIGRHLNWWQWPVFVLSFVIHLVVLWWLSLGIPYLF